MATGSSGCSPASFTETSSTDRSAVPVSRTASTGPSVASPSHSRMARTYRANASRPSTRPSRGSSTTGSPAKDAASTSGSTVAISLSQGTCRFLACLRLLCRARVAMQTPRKEPAVARYLKRRLSPPMVVALLGLFVALGGPGYAATGGNFVLGLANDAMTPTRLTAPVTTNALQVTNTDTTAGSTALSLVAAPNHPALKVNTQAKVPLLNV